MMGNGCFKSMYYVQSPFESSHLPIFLVFDEVINSDVIGRVICILESASRDEVLGGFMLSAG